MKKSVKPLLDPVSKKSLSKDVPKLLHLQKPLQDDGLFRTKAAPSPPAAAPGILLFSLTSVNSRSILIGSFLNLVLILSVAFQARATSMMWSTRTSLGSVLVSTICLSPGIGGVLDTSIGGLGLTRMSVDS